MKVRVLETMVKKMFEFGFTLEEIVMITNMELSAIAKYISTEDIVERYTELKSLPKKHPYLKIFKEE